MKGFRTRSRVTLLLLADDDHSGEDALTQAWLMGWVERARNVVQLSRPRPLVATSAELALDVIFEHMIEDPARNRYRFMTRRAVYGEMRRAYWALVSGVA